jgi:hypothetical protein
MPTSLKQSRRKHINSEVEQSTECPRKWNLDASSTAIMMYLEPEREHCGNGPMMSKCSVSNKEDGMWREW